MVTFGNCTVVSQEYHSAFPIAVQETGNELFQDPILRRESEHLSVLPARTHKPIKTTKQPTPSKIYSPAHCPHIELLCNIILLFASFVLFILCTLSQDRSQRNNVVGLKGKIKIFYLHNFGN